MNVDLLGQTLEEAVYEYIESFQVWENGKGLGMSCDDLNKNIAHPEKPHGKGSEKEFVALMREMPSLIESEQKWKGKIVFQLNETQSELVQAKKLLTTATHDMQCRLHALHPSAARVNICREEFTHMLEDLMAANELLTIAQKAFTSAN